MRIKGKITSWNEDKAYGFISPFPEGKRVFVHINAFRNLSRRPGVGLMVNYEMSTDRQGRPCAVRATLAGDRPPIDRSKRKGTWSTGAAIGFLLVVAVSTLSGRLPPIVFAVYIGLSILTYIAYALDKSAARKGAWRTQESTLHLMALAGGWPGALIAQQKLRHKSSKQAFRFEFWITVVLNCGLFIWLFSEAGSSMLSNLLQSVTNI